MDIDVISLFEPECGARESECVQAVLDSGRWSDGPMLEAFERAFAGWVGRRHAVAVGSGTLGTWIALRALGIGPGDEVVCSSHSWHQVAQAITLAGATAVFADIDYWSGSLSPEKAALKIGPRTRALLAGNTNGHPAAWEPLRTLAQAHGLHLIEDSSEALGSRYRGQSVGTFGDVSVFDFRRPRRCARAKAACCSPTTRRWRTSCAICASAGSPTATRCRWARACPCRPA